MYLSLKGKDLYKQYVCYSLTTTEGVTINAGVCRLEQLFLFNGFQIGDIDFYLTIHKSDSDINMVFNKAIELAQTQPSVSNDIMISIQRLQNKPTRKQGVSVICNETGERFDSINQACEKHGLSYSQLCKHLSGSRGFKSVKNRTYKRV